MVFSLKKTKKIKFLIFSIGFFISSLKSQATPYISVDADNGYILAHHEIFNRWYPASLTKLMTSYLAFSALKSGKFQAGTPVLLTENASNSAPTLSGYKKGSVLRFDAALQIMLIRSANDLAVALAEAMAKSEEAFVQQMNFTAQRLGMQNTHFTNCHGLPDKNHYSTAYDLALLSYRLRKDFPEFAYFFNIGGLDISKGKTILKNTNNLLGRFPGANGLKTGFTCASGYNLAASATRGRRTIIAVVLGSDSIEKREIQTAKLLTEGFAQKGSSTLTLENIEPYGKDIYKVKDMRKFTCSPKAHKRNKPYRSQSRKVVFHSPYIDPEPQLKTVLHIDPFATTLSLLAQK